MLLVWAILSLPLHGKAAVNKLLIVWAVMLSSPLYAIVYGIMKRKAGNQ